MNAKNFSIATLAGTVTSFIAGFLIYGIALSSYMAANTMSGVFNAEPDMLWLVISHILMGATITYIYGRWAGIKTLQTGLTAGLVVGILIGLSWSTIMFATSNLYSGLPAVIVDGIASGLIFACGGAGVGWALGRFE